MAFGLPYMKKSLTQQCKKKILTAPRQQSHSSEKSFAEGLAEDTVFAQPTEDTTHFQFKCNYSLK